MDADLQAMFDLAITMNGGKARGALAIMRTGAFLARWQEIKMREAQASFDAYLNKLLAVQASITPATPSPT